LIKIGITEDPFRNFVVLTVSDNGKGMSTEQLKQIGLPFFTTKSKGTGLGSMVTNKIIHEMKGIIEYESELNKGTTVKISLPLVKNGKL
jgi:two-component system, sporulation sensor kinase B